MIELDAQRKTAARMLATNKAISDHINKVVAAADIQITNNNRLSPITTTSTRTATTVSSSTKTSHNRSINRSK